MLLFISCVSLKVLTAFGQEQSTPQSATNDTVLSISPSPSASSPSESASTSSAPLWGVFNHDSGSAGALGLLPFLGASDLPSSQSVTASADDGGSAAINTPAQTAAASSNNIPVLPPGLAVIAKMFGMTTPAGSQATGTTASAIAFDPSAGGTPLASQSIPTAQSPATAGSAVLTPSSDSSPSPSVSTSGDASNPAPLPQSTSPIDQSVAAALVSSPTSSQANDMDQTTNKLSILPFLFGSRQTAGPIIPPGLLPLPNPPSPPDEPPPPPGKGPDPKDGGQVNPPNPPPPGNQEPSPTPAPPVQNPDPKKGDQAPPPNPPPAEEPKSTTALTTLQTVSTSRVSSTVSSTSTTSSTSSRPACSLEPTMNPNFPFAFGTDGPIFTSMTLTKSLVSVIIGDPNKGAGDKIDPANNPPIQDTPNKCLPEGGE